MGVPPGRQDRGRIMRTSRAKRGILYSTLTTGVLALGQASAIAAVIATTDIAAIPSGATGSGNGTLDLRMLTFSGSEIQNQSGAFNGDNANSSLPNSGGADTSSFAESYVTTAGDLKAFYNLNFAPNSINQIVLFLDLNETGGGAPNNTLAKLDIVLNPASVQGSPNPANDVTSAQQAAIDQVHTGGSVIADLNPQPANNMPVNAQGAGFADYAIFTGVNPFALNDGDVLLFNISMNTLNNGAEEFFLSGTYSPGDIREIIPEPATSAIITLAAIGAVLRRRRHR
jgi:hypothetical protein